MPAAFRRFYVRRVSFFVAAIFFSARFRADTLQRQG